MVADLRERFGLKRIVFVGDRGMLSEESREVLREAGCGYLLGFPRPNCSEAEAHRTPLERKLKAAGEDLSAKAAVKALVTT